MSLSEPLSPEMRLALDTVLDNLPNFTRQFPVARYLDEEQIRFRNPVAEPAAGQVIHDAHAHDVISDETAEQLEALVEPIEDGEVQAEKQARAAIFTARNLIYAALGVIAATVVTETTLGVTDGLRLRDNITAWFRAKPEAVRDIMKDAPADVRASVQARIDGLGGGPAPATSPTPTPRPKR